MPKISHECLKIIQEALERYIEEVENSLLSIESKKTYKEHPRNFVRWLDNDFEPGILLRGQRGEQT